MSMTTLFLDQVMKEGEVGGGGGGGELAKVVSIIETQLLLMIHTMTNDSRLVQLFWFVKFLFLVNYHVQKRL